MKSWFRCSCSLARCGNDKKSGGCRQFQACFSMPLSVTGSSFVRSYISHRWPFYRDTSMPIPTSVPTLSTHQHRALTGLSNYAVVSCSEGTASSVALLTPQLEVVAQQ